MNKIIFKFCILIFFIENSNTSLVKSQPECNYNDSASLTPKEDRTESILIPFAEGEPKCYYDGRGSLTATCENVTANYFPNTGYKFDSLDETVKCLYCNLGTIKPNTFDIIGNRILNLDLQNSNITSLATASFLGLVFMETLNLAYNNIKIVIPGTFDGIKKLNSLDLSYNLISILVNEGFAELESLTVLHLNDNLINHIDPNAFDKLFSLKELHIQNNYISSIEGALIGLNSIRIINLENNTLSTLNSEGINSTSLLDLNLSKNKLKNLEEGTVIAPRLESITLSNNKIDTIKPGAFKGSKMLEYIDLANNKIQKLEQSTFARLYNLRQIDLNHNNLTVLQTSVFTHLPELRYLNVSYNQIKMLQRDGVLSLYNLHSLDISHNNITYLDYKLLIDHAPRLVFINLENNDLPCYLVEEMMEFFEEDYIEFSLDDRYGKINETCNATALMLGSNEIDAGEATNPTTNAVESYKSSTSDVNVIYSLVFILIGLVIVLFFLQYKIYKRLRYNNLVNIAKVGLISSRGLENPDNEYYMVS